MQYRLRSKIHLWEFQIKNWRWLIFLQTRLLFPKLYHLLHNFWGDPLQPGLPCLFYGHLHFCEKYVILNFWLQEFQYKLWSLVKICKFTKVCTFVEETRAKWATPGKLGPSKLMQQYTKNLKTIKSSGKDMDHRQMLIYNNHRLYFKSQSESTPSRERCDQLPHDWLLGPVFA